MAAGLTAQDSKNVFFKGLSLYLESDEKRGNIKGEFYVEDMLELYKVQGTDNELWKHNWKLWSPGITQ